jgi:hypothetical protein
MYTTNGSEACEYIATHSGAEAVILEDTTHLTKYYSILDKIPKVKLFVIWKGTVPTDLPEKLKGKVLTWAQFIAYAARYYLINSVISQPAKRIRYNIGRPLKNQETVQLLSILRALLDPPKL